jgi:hypothetical protein
MSPNSTWLSYLPISQIGKLEQVDSLWGIDDGENTNKIKFVQTPGDFS